MTKKYSTKRSLIASILILCLCFTSFVGTTFAWFTDEVTSSGNKIVSGSLKIDLEVLDKESGKWSSLKESKAPIFNYENWEPGYVDAKVLKVDNEGTLALKWKAKFVAKEALGILADVIDVYVLPYGVLDDASTVGYPADRDLEAAGYTKVGTVRDFVNTIETTTVGELLAGKSAYLGIALKMQESAGNDYQKQSLGAFDIQIVATQLASEEDSFGKDYDEGAEYDGEITNSDGFKAALAAGGTYKVMNDFTLDGTAEIPAGKTVVLDLNRKNITASATAIKNNGELTIYNKASAAAYGMRATAVGGGIDVSSATEEAQAINNSGKLVLNGGSYVGTVAPFSYAILSNGDLTINDANVYGGFGGVWVYGGSNAVINGGYYTNGDDQGAHVIYAKSSNLTINGGEFEGFVQDNNYYQYVVYANSDAKVDIYGGTYTAAVKANGNKALFADNSPVTVYGGRFDIDPTAFISETRYVINDLGDYVVTMDKTDLKEEIADAVADAIANGETEVVVDVHGTDIGGLDYGLNTSLVPAGTTVTIKNAVVSASSYGNAVDGTVVFENCVFNNKNGAYSIHFDAGSGNVVFKNCELAGWCSFGTAIKSVSFEGCEFKHNGHYGHTRFYQPVSMKDCVFASDVTVDAATNCELVLDNCKVDNGDYITSIFYIDDCFTGITIDGVKVAYTQATFAAACAQGATVYVIGNDAGEIYDLKNNQHDGLSVIGLGNDVKVVNNTKYASGKAIGAIWQKIHLENVTVTNTVYTMADGGDATFKNVYFEAGFRQGYGKNVVFDGCSFGSNSEGYALHFQTDSASEGGNITIKDCEFRGGKVHLGGKRAYAFTGCEFAEGTDFQVWSTITLDGCTVNGVEVTAENANTLFPKLDLTKVTFQ